ncbi:hypothetical protein, partial [Klebsiella pneumoniae]|uniref:hypothetical protein n=1 Tax=Klebsiella pneumoniae TaxID=573 RepID=UPI001D0EB04E
LAVVAGKRAIWYWKALTSLAINIENYLVLESLNESNHLAFVAEKRASHLVLESPNKFGHQHREPSGT